MRKCGLGFFFLSILLGMGGLARGENLVRNPGFEEGTGPWQVHVLLANANGAIDGTTYHHGSKSFRLWNKSKSMPNVFVRVFQQVQRLKPNTLYRIGTWCKGQGAGDAWIGGGVGWQIRESLPQGDFDWTQISLEWATGPKETEFDLMVAVDGPTTALWIDDVEVVEVQGNAEEKAQIEAGTREVRARFEKMRQSLKDHPDMGSDVYVTLGVEVAGRFVARLEDKAGSQSPKWSQMQIREVGEVLDKTERDITRLRCGKQTIVRGNPVVYSCGYVGWDAVKDFPCFQKLGVTLFQTERGPAELQRDGTLDPKGLAFVNDTLNAAHANGMKVDLILSPHWFPKWAIEESSDLGDIRRFGFIKYNIDHPKARTVVQKWLEEFIPRVKDHPALYSFCLSNEPMYVNSGKDQYSKSLWPAFLKRRHGGIETLNALYGTHYKDFAAVPVPDLEMPAKLGDQRRFYDWVNFNQEHFADWHRWMNQIIKKKAPTIPTHSKIMAHFFSREMIVSGIDPELICDITDFAGNDAYAYVTPQGPYAYNWAPEEIWYDLLHSFRDQPVFNSENHTIKDGFEGPVPSANTYAALWQGAIHHQRATTLWVWCEAETGELRGSLYFRPANVYSAGRAMLDLNRLSDQIKALGEARPRVALLASMNSVFWEFFYVYSLK